MGQTTGKFRRRAKGFAQVSNTALMDHNLSAKAKGIYAMIEAYLSVPNFQLFKSFLIHACSDGERSFESGWRELKEAGYLKIYKIQTSKGFIYEYELLDSPNPSKCNPGNSILGELSHENSNIGERGIKNNNLKNNTNINNNLINNYYSTNVDNNISSETAVNQVVVNKTTKTSWETFNEKIQLEKERTKQAYQLSDDFYTAPDQEFQKLIKAFNTHEKQAIESLSEESCWDIYQTYLLLKGYLPDELEEAPKINKTPEAYVRGMLKNKIEK